MIYTVTFNPSIDYIISMDNFSLGKTNRTTEEKMFGYISEANRETEGGTIL